MVDTALPQVLNNYCNFWQKNHGFVLHSHKLARQVKSKSSLEAFLSKFQVRSQFMKMVDLSATRISPYDSCEQVWKALHVNAVGGTKQQTTSSIPAHSIAGETSIAERDRLVNETLKI